MLLTDSDGLIYKVKAENEDKELFDFSNYPKDSKCYNNSNNLV